MSFSRFGSPQQPIAPTFPTTRTYSVEGSFLVQGTNTSGVTPVPYADLFNLHIQLYSGHIYNLVMTFVLTANNIQVVFGNSDEFPIVLAANQSGIPGVGGGPTITNTAPTNAPIVAGFTANGITTTVYVAGIASAFTEPVSGSGYQSITTTDFYLSANTYTNTFNTTSSFTVSSITLDVLDFGPQVQ